MNVSYSFLFIISLVVVFNEVFSDQPPKLNFNNASTKRKLGPCQACKVLIDSFKKGMDKTSRGKFEGGDAAWEEEKLGSYLRSEVRLVEIQESLCNDIKDHNDQCHLVAEEAEHFIEEWWFAKTAESDDLHQWLCVDKLKHCCPAHHFGKDCKPCTGGAENVCNGNGKCKGDGTRKGNGECVCEKGYTGSACIECAKNYYMSYKDDTKMICSQCHKACKDVCSQAGAKGCSVCNDGWIMDTDRGCVDVNECTNQDACEMNKFCVNNDGSFSCLDCDKSCLGCSGDGPDMCIKCASGYSMKDNVCVDSTKEDIKFRVTITRYLTYFGLVITVCILFQKSILLAGILGLLVAAYITVSEYMLGNEALNVEPTIDTSTIDWANLLKNSMS